MAVLHGTVWLPHLVYFYTVAELSLRSDVPSTLFLSLYLPPSRFLFFAGISLPFPPACVPGNWV